MSARADDPGGLLLGAFLSALDTVSPARLLAPHLGGPRPDFILAVGKASVPMARAALDVHPGVPALVVTPHGTAPDPEAPTSEGWAGVDVIEAGHPVPDGGSIRAGHAALEALGALRAGQGALVLLSGGGSALLCAPRGVTLAQKQALTGELLRCGADVTEINTVRKHLSAVKGGQLAQVTRAQLRTLVLSDVVGDPLDMIASGPTVPDPTTFADALAVLDRYGLAAPEARAHFRSGAPDTPDTLPDAPATVIGGNRHLLDAARSYLTARGVRTLILGDTFTGEARALAAFHASLIRSVREHGTPTPRPVAFLSGGEATVTLGPDAGRGGRNLEFALALLTELGGTPAGLRGVHVLSAGSDGVDGSSDAAGAVLHPDSLDRARALGLDPRGYLRRHDAHPFFDALGDLLRTGPTGHNVGDVRAILIE
ncbi:glycerate kinase type-2 family protein [Deinococcus soli (ex Cha et al. 2016)]|uniref:Hydroxypyruvate reductase n=1 Tax=Deinococcus soli (ex Cha et al. 2016) TaxID=1309411 RepID=A0A0F7JMZ7_9DEIO|nr:glycerate kinase [Deinococcus soli (ex Cha et al. 2016)]AKH16173.1 hydroxypyruvate reductase [Deinococcus soli (ex Cha et al. 2016)]